MRCKYCHNELEAGSTVCPACGTEIKEKKSGNLAIKILAFCLAGIVLLGALAGAINYGLTGKILPGIFRPNDIFYKDSYSVSLKKMNTPSGNRSFQKSREDVVATMGEHVLTNRLLQVYYWDAASSSEYSDLKKDVPLDQQYQDPITQKTWQQYFIEQSIDTWRRDMLVKQLAADAGFEMPEEYVSQFATLEKDIISTATSNNFTTMDAFLESMLGRGTSFQVYYDYLWNYFIGGTYWAEFTETVEVDMAEIEAYYEEHQSELKIDEYYQVTKTSGKLVDIRHILIKPEADILDKDGKATGISDASWEACRVKAQALLDQWLAGEATEESFAALAAEKTEDGGSKSTGGLYTDVYKGMMVQAFNDWCFEEGRQAGDYGLVKTNYGYHIMYFSGAEEGWIRLCTEGAKSKKASDMMEELVAQTTIAVDYKKIALAEMD